MLRPVPLNQGASEVAGIKAGVSEKGLRLSAFFFFAGLNVSLRD